MPSFREIRSELSVLPSPLLFALARREISRSQDIKRPSNLSTVRSVGP